MESKDAQNRVTRTTIQNFRDMNDTAIEKQQKYQAKLAIKMALRNAKQPLRHHKRAMKLTEEQRKYLDEMEHSRTTKATLCVSCFSNYRS